MVSLRSIRSTSKAWLITVNLFISRDLFLLRPCSGLSLSSPYANKIAVVLNVNARSVSPSSVAITENIVGKENVFVTTSIEDNDVAAKKIVDRGYKTVVPAGGDGTLCSVINSVVNFHREKYEAATPDSSNIGGQIRKESSDEPPTQQKLPRFAFLPLGTGNGMGMLVGPRIKGKKKDKVAQMLTRLKKLIEESEKHKDSVPVLKCPMIEIIKPQSGNAQNMNKHGELCFFAGAGFDSLMLNDFNIVKRWSSNKPGLRFLGSVVGYTVALVVRTLPQCLIWGRHKLSIRITVPKQTSPQNTSSTATLPTYWIDPRRGDTAMKVLPTYSSTQIHNEQHLFQKSEIDSDRQLLFEGETGIVAAGTTPYYGGGLKLFPFSRLQPHQMHLRLGRINPIIGFLNIPWIFRGSYRHYNMGCMDFLGQDFDIELSKPYPFQHSGEAVDEGIKRFRLKIASEEIEFIDFLKPRLVVGY